jgi:polyhydroxybutyrate depolymerase
MPKNYRETSEEKNRWLLAALSFLTVALVLSSCRALEKQQNHYYNIVVDGVERSYIVHVPRSYEPSRGASVLLIFHGGGVDAEQQMVLSGLNKTADSQGFLAVYPQGTGALFGKWRTWNAGSCCGKAQRQNVDDVKFIAMMIDDLSLKYNVNQRQIFATGMSNGGMMVYRLACEQSSRIAAIAPVAATMSVDQCKPSRALSVLHIHGRADEFVPFKGGYGRNTDNGPFRSVDDTIALFVTLNGCQKTPQLTYQKGDVQCLSYIPCRDNAEVTLCSVEGGGHTWPQGTPFPKGGRTTNDISANEAMWKFFQAHPMPEKRIPPLTQ